MLSKKIKTQLRSLPVAGFHGIKKICLKLQILLGEKF